MYFPTPDLNVLSLTPGIATLDILFSSVRTFEAILLPGVFINASCLSSAIYIEKIKNNNIMII